MGGDLNTRRGRYLVSTLVINRTLSYEAHILSTRLSDPVSLSSPMLRSSTVYDNLITNAPTRMIPPGHVKLIVDARSLHDPRLVTSQSRVDGRGGPCKRAQAHWPMAIGRMSPGKQRDQLSLYMLISITNYHSIVLLVLVILLCRALDDRHEVCIDRSEATRIPWKINSSSETIPVGRVRGYT